MVLDERRRTIAIAVLEAIREMVESDDPVEFDEMKPKYQEAMAVAGDKIAAVVLSLEEKDDDAND